MATIPQLTARRSLDPGNVVQYPTGPDPVGAELEKSGDKLQNLAVRFHAREEQQQRFEALIGFDGFQQQMQTATQQATQSAQPGARGLHDNLLETFDTQSRQWLDSVPERVRPEFELRMRARREQFSRNAAALELSESNRFQTQGITDRLGAATNGVLQSGPEAIEPFTRDVHELIENSSLTPIQKEEAKRKVTREIQEAGFRSLISRDPAAAQQVAAGWGLGQQQGWKAALTNRESSGNPRLVNQLGYAGLFQFGAPRLADLGIYTPGANENLSGWSSTGRNAPGKWSGTFNIPGFPEVKTLQQFLANPEAQNAAFTAHVARMDQEIASRGLDRFIGQTVGGINITKEGIYSMMHLGGAAGAQAALEGRSNARDANGTSVLQYARLGLAGGQAAAGQEDARFKDIPAERRLVLAGLADHGVQQQQAANAQQQTQQYQAQLNDLKTRIIDNRATAADVEDARQQGWLTDADTISRLRGAIVQRDSALQNVQAFNQALNTPGFAWNRVQKEHKDMAEAGFQSLGGTMEALQTVAERTGMVPQSAGVALRGALNSSDPRRTEAALNVAANLLARDQQIFTGVDGHTEIERLATRFNHFVDHQGMTPAEATKKIIEMETPAFRNDVRARLRAEDIDKMMRDQTNNGTLLSDMMSGFSENKIFGYAVRGFRPAIDANPEARRVAVNDFADIVKTKYLESGDLAEAKAQAVRQMSRIWGISYTNGSTSGVFMRYAPDRAPALAGIPDASARVGQLASDFIKEQSGQTVPRARIAFFPMENAQTATPYLSAGIVPYRVGWKDDSGNMQFAQMPFRVDPATVRAAVSQERQAGLEAANAQSVRSRKTFEAAPGAGQAGPASLAPQPEPEPAAVKPTSGGGGGF